VNDDAPGESRVGTRGHRDDGALASLAGLLLEALGLGPAASREGVQASRQGSRQGQADLDRQIGPAQQHLAHRGFVAEPLDDPLEAAIGDPSARVGEQVEHGVARADFGERPRDGRGNPGAAGDRPLSRGVGESRLVDEFRVAQDRRMFEHRRRDVALVLKEARERSPRRVRRACQGLRHRGADGGRRVVEHGEERELRLVPVLRREVSVKESPRQGADGLGAVVLGRGLRPQDEVPDEDARGARLRRNRILRENRRFANGVVGKRPARVRVGPSVDDLVAPLYALGTGLVRQARRRVVTGRVEDGQEHQRFTRAPTPRPLSMSPLWSMKR
jgi:hypothetical protein